MKKFLSLALALIMVLSLVACGDTASDDTNTGDTASDTEQTGEIKGLTAEERAKEFITVGTGPTSGIYFPIGGAFATALKEYGYQTSAEATNATGQNIQNILNGDAEIAIAMQDAVMQAYTGTGAYEGKGEASDLRALIRLWPNYVQLVTVEGTGINSVEDLRGKRVCVGDVGSGTYFNALDVFAAYDMTIDDVSPVYQSFGDSTESLKDGKIDAAFVVAGAPTPAVTDLCTTKGAYLVSLDDEHIVKLKEISGAYTECTIPGGTYEGIDDDVKTVAVKATIIASDKVTDEEAYAIVSTIFENKDAIAELHAKGAELDLEYASSCGLPYHPGAAKYFAEKGLTVTE